MFHRFLRPADATPAEADAPRPAPRESVVGETATVRRIVARLEALPPAEARFLAGFAYILSRAAEADLEISEAETRVMEQALMDLGDLDEPQAVLVVEMAKLQARAQGATEDFLVTREFARIASDEQKLAVLRCAFLVAAADDSISAEEATVVNEIARELDVPRPALNAVRDEFVDRFSAIRAMRNLGTNGGAGEG